MSLIDELKEALEKSPCKFELIQEIREVLFEHSKLRDMPVDFVQWVPIDDVVSNEYNPNSVAQIELGLLQLSILNDGFTQPIVTIFDEEKQKYVIVDGFHRYFSVKVNEEIRGKTGGLLPVVVLHKGLADRMASTVRHNRARGKHSVEGMSDLVFQMLEEGLSDSDICNELGMEAEELVKLKHLTGFSKLFENTHYRKAWETASQIQARRAYEESLKEEKT